MQSSPGLLWDLNGDWWRSLRFFGEIPLKNFLISPSSESTLAFHLRRPRPENCVFFSMHQLKPSQLCRSASSQARQPDLRKVRHSARQHNILHWQQSCPRLYLQWGPTLLCLCEQQSVMDQEIITNQNPADHATRSVPAHQLKATNWFAGPKFLLSQNKNIPESSYDLTEPSLDADIRPQVSTLKTTPCTKQLGSYRFIKFSSWKSLVCAFTRLFHIAQAFSSPIVTDVTIVKHESL